jgi:DNA-binding response OmpR family regulator
MRILFTSSDRVLLASVCETLAEYGHVVDAVPCDALLSWRPRTLHELVIADLSASADGAASQLDHLRELEPRARMLVIGERLTLHLRATASERGIDAFLARPFRLMELLAAIGAATR